MIPGNQAEGDSLRATLQRIGSRHALEAPVIVTAFLVFVTMSFANGQLRMHSEPVPNLLSGLLSAAIGATFLVLARSTVLPTSARPSRPSAVALVYGASGAVFGSTRMAVAPLFDLARGTPLDRLVLPPILLLIFLTAVCDWRASRAEQREMLERLLRNNERLTMLRANYAEQAARFREELDGQVREAMDPLVARIRRRLTELDATIPAEVRAASELLLVAARDVVRPLSHRLAQPDQRDLDLDTSGPRIAGTALAFPRFVDVPASLHPPHVGLAGVLLAFIAATAQPGLGVTWSTGLPAVYAINAVCAVIAWPAIALVRRGWPSRWQVLTTPVAFATTFVLFGTVLLAARLLLVRWLTPSYFEKIVSPGLVVALLPVTAMAMLLSIEGIARQHRADIRASIATVNHDLDLAVARLRKELWHNRITLSRLLHGPVQSALLSTAAVMTSPHLLSDRLEEQLQIIEEAVAELQSGRLQAMCVAPVVADLIRLWGFSCAIEVRMPPAVEARLDQDAPTTQSVTSIMREAVSNAVRHGRATRVEVQLEAQQDGLLRLRIADNGTGLQADAVPGLGTALLEETTYRWSREDSGQGVTIVADLAW